MGKMVVAVLVLVIGLNSISQLLFKSLFHQRTFVGGWASAVPLLFDWRLWGGIAAQFLFTAFWWWLLSKQPLSVVFPALTGGMFIIIALASAALFGESLSGLKLGGIALIWMGLVILSQANG